jgi:acetylornithine deacetylase/succinyl-diaminopimelate desuccinylase-like protein
MAISTRTDLKSTLSELVAMPTLTDQTATCRAAIDWIRYYIRDLPLHYHEIVHRDHPSLVITTRDTRRPKLMLHAHLDVAPASPGAFKLSEREGKYWGRGVFDMKFAAACYLKLLHELGPELPDYDLGVTFTTDEETTGGADGAAFLAGAGWGGDVMLNPDAVPGWAIQRAAKGLVRFRIDSDGVTGHGSRPWMYRNAIRQLMDVLDDIQARFPVEPCGDPLHIHPTMNIGLIEGGAMANQVPGHAFAEIDIRIIPGQTSADAVALVQDVARYHEYVTADTLALGEPVEIDPASQPVRHIQRLVEEVTGARPELVVSHGGSESGYYAERGIPVLMLGPEGGGHHSSSEWISVQALHHFYEVLRRYTEQIAH